MSLRKPAASVSLVELGQALVCTADEKARGRTPGHAHTLPRTHSFRPRCGLSLLVPVYPWAFTSTYRGVDQPHFLLPWGQPSYFPLAKGKVVCSHRPPQMDLPIQVCSPLWEWIGGELSRRGTGLFLEEDH